MASDPLHPLRRSARLNPPVPATIQNTISTSPVSSLSSSLTTVPDSPAVTGSPALSYPNPPAPQDMANQFNNFLATLQRGMQQAAPCTVSAFDGTDFST